MTPRFHRIDDARRTLGFIAILVFITPTAFGQLAQPGPEREKASFAQFHNELRKYAHLHDTYIGVAPIGNEETVPLLLKRLRQDFGASEPSHPSGTGMAFDCAQVHLIDALREITNTDQGMFYPRWAAWWERITAGRSVNGCSTVFLWTAFTLSIP
jgi:hypothetical protein